MNDADINVDNPSAEAAHTPSQPRRWWALAAVALGVSLVIMDATIVNVALPVVITDLGLTATQAEWMNAVYALVLAATLLTAGRAGDLWGRRAMLIAGMIVFGGASVVAATALAPEALIGARLVQGLGAALVLPATLSTVNAMFKGKDRAIAFAVWGSTIGGMAAVGPLAGGWLATELSWRWAFGLNVPLVIVVIALAWWAVPETRELVASRRLDVAGALLSAAGLGAIVFALIEGASYGWWLQADGTLSPIPVIFAAGLILVGVFVAQQRRARAAGRPVLVDLGLLRVPSFRYGSIAALIVSFGEFGLLFALPLLLQNALGYSALGTGWLILALAVGTFLISGASPQLTSRIGARAVVRVGLALEAVAVIGLAIGLSASIPSAAIAGWLFLYGAGVGLATAQLTNVILVDVPSAESGQASGLQSTFRQLGSALGVAILGTVLITNLGNSTLEGLNTEGVAQASTITAAVKDSAGAVIPALQANPETALAGDAAAAAMIDAARLTTGLAGGIILVGLAATLALPREPRRQEAPGSNASESVV